MARSSKEALKHFKKLGLDIRLGAKVSGAEQGASGVKLKYADAKGEQSVEVDKVIVAIGRRPYSKDLLGEGTGVQIDERGFVKVDHDCRTDAANVWAVGDLVRGPMLAHKGKEEGVMVADLIAGKFARGQLQGDSVGHLHGAGNRLGRPDRRRSEAQRPRLQGRLVPVPGERTCARDGSDRRLLQGRRRRRDDDEILGVHIIGPMAGELIAEAVLAMEYSASTEDLQRTIHAHPTLSEALHEAALNADKIAIDFPNR